MRTKLFALTLSLIFGLGLFGQTFGDISGEVRDSSGAAIQGVLVTATNTQTNVSRTATTCGA